MQRRLVVGMAAAAVLLALSAPLATATTPVHGSYEWDGDNVLAGVCAFDVAIQTHISASYTQTLDADGNQTKWIEQGIEQDVFKANGHELVGLPFRYVGQVHSDADGNWTSYYAMGGVERVPLPDGRMFWSAGRFDWLPAMEQGVSFTLTPDNGHSGNVDAFCAALS
jgi:hypothetical protein